MTNIARTLYTGVTNDLERRVYEHKMKLIPGFAARHSLDRLVYYETGENITGAINREKQIKGWLRSKKIKLIESMNPEWKDLSSDWDNGYSNVV
jgi:putative endonuclease